VSSHRRIAVVPAYNEESTVRDVLDRLAPMVDQLLVVDDGSTDRTRAVIEELLPGHPNVRLLVIERNQGMSAAYHLAFSDLRHRLLDGELDADDWILTVDADGQHDPAAVDGLVLEAEQGRLDALLARRDLSGYPWIKRAGNRILSTWAGWWAGAPLLDVESGLRIFRLAALADALRFYRGYRYSETVEVAVVLCRLGYRVRNDILVPVPLYRSRTRLRDAAIDLAAIPLAARRVGRRRAPRPAGDAEELVQAHRFETPGGQAVEDDRQGGDDHGPVGDQVAVEPVVEIDDRPAAGPGQDPAGH